MYNNKTNCRTEATEEAPEYSIYGRKRKDPNA